MEVWVDPFKDMNLGLGQKKRDNDMFQDRCTVNINKKAFDKMRDNVLLSLETRSSEAQLVA